MTYQTAWSVETSDSPLTAARFMCATEDSVLLFNGGSGDSLLYKAISPVNGEELSSGVSIPYDDVYFQVKKIESNDSTVHVLYERSLTYWEVADGQIIVRSLGSDGALISEIEIADVSPGDTSPIVPKTVTYNGGSVNVDAVYGSSMMKVGNVTYILVPMIKNYSDYDVWDTFCTLVYGINFSSLNVDFCRYTEFPALSSTVEDPIPPIGGDLLPIPLGNYCSFVGNNYSVDVGESADTVTSRSLPAGIDVGYCLGTGKAQLIFDLPELP